VTRTISSDTYAWTGAYNVSRSYAVNGLNQYTAAGPATFAYDANGNLSSDGSTSFIYDAENRLVSATGAKNASLTYDPLGRLFQVTSGATTTRFLYDGDELVAEYDGAGTLIDRYVHGASVDDPQIWYEGATLATRRFLYADHQGSVIAVADNAGASVATNGYDAWGIPNPNNLGRFQYAGQAWLAELGMYHYKARLYSPTLGRFLQTDPIGYKDQINLYAYVGNDPTNQTDSMGLCTLAKNAKDNTPAGDICHPASSLNTSSAGRTAIREGEGRRTHVYQDSGGLPTVGIGHLVTPADHLGAVSEITDERVETLFSSDLAVAEAGVERVVGDLPVSQREFDALTDLVFNVGEGRLSATNSPGLNNAIDRQDYARIGDQIRYTRDASGHTPQGLIDRNDRRQNIFRYGNYEQIPH
jgi:RHS repeat-associated protein